MQKLPKLQAGDKIAVLSLSFAAPGMFPAEYELGLTRLREVFGLEPVEFPATKKLGASGEERAADLIAAFQDSAIKAVMASIGGDDQVTYVKNLPSEPFKTNPKPFFGFSDNTHFCDFLWRNGVPSYYGASLMTQLSMQGEMDAYTVDYLRKAMFETGEFELIASETFNEITPRWGPTDDLAKRREYEPNNGFFWDGVGKAEGILWGGCLESLDEILRHGLPVPSLDECKNMVLMTETSEEIPTADNVHRFYRALGERGILGQVQAVLVGRPKAWSFTDQRSPEDRAAYRKAQREAILSTVREYSKTIPVIQNLNFGHTDPQIAMPYGGKVRIDADVKKIWASF